MASLRVFRDRSDSMDVDPRLPVGKHGNSVLLASTRIIFEMYRVRIDYEQLGLERECYGLTRMFNDYGRSLSEYKV